MDHVGSGTPEGVVQRAHQKKKGATRVKSDLKPFGPQLFAEYAKSKEAVD
jgi:hypothetical protein